MFTLFGEVGSPPRVRGKPAARKKEEIAQRLTPACAGKTSELPTARTFAAAHPRVCGENRAVLVALSARWGSPPRVRGKLCHLCGEPITDRLTPACAGKTGEEAVDVCEVGAHPRVCGENARRAARLDFICGSPPRVRGKLARHTDGVQGAGLTPACAGKTSRSRCRGC